MFLNRPSDRDVGIGVVGAGFIVRDCHLVAYAEPVSAWLGSRRGRSRRRTKWPRCGACPRSTQSVDEMLDDPAVEVVDIAVPPAEQPGVIDRCSRTAPRARHSGPEAAGDVVREAKRAGRGMRASRRACFKSTRTCGMITRCGP